MAGDAVCPLASCEIHGHGDDLLCLDLEIDRIRYGKCAVGDTDSIFTTKGDLLKRLRLDVVDTSGLVCGKCNGNSSDGEVGATEDVCEFQADLIGVGGHVERLTNGTVDEDGASLVLCGLG